MMTEVPIFCEFDGKVFEPVNRVWARRAFDAYTVGVRYFVEGKEQRSIDSHNHYFSALNDAWANLPESKSGDFATMEHLRKFALIKTGWHDERSIVAASKAEALRVAAFVKPMDDLAIVVTRESTVTIYTAKSQSMRAMGAADFQKSKHDVLGVVAGMIGVDPDVLKREAGASA